MLREDFLQQNGFMEVDWYSSYERQDKMIQMILDYDKLCRAAIEKGRHRPSCSPSLPGSRWAGPKACRTTGTPPSTPIYGREMEEQIAAIAARRGAEEADPRNTNTIQEVSGPLMVVGQVSRRHL